MFKFKPRIYSTLLALFILSSSTVAVIHTEQEKNYYKAKSLENYYSEVYTNWDNYQSEYLAAVQQLRDENRNNMQATKENYEKLLSEQPSLIASHTRTVQQTTYVAQNAPSSGSSGKTQTSKQVISVPRPKAVTSTGAS